MPKNNMIIMVFCTIAIAICTGCDSHAKRKQAALLRWEKATAHAKLPIAEEQFENEKYDKAIETLIKCLDADPEMPGAHLLAAKIHLAQGRAKASRQSLLRATEINENMDQAWYMLAVLAQQSSNTTLAMEYYKKALTLKPNNIEYITAVAELYAAEKNYDQALELLDDKSFFMQGNVDLKVTTANILLRNGNTAGAIIMYNQAILLKDNDTEIMEALGYCYIADKQWAQAANMFEKLMRNSTGPQKLSYMQLLATCSMNAGQYGKAMSCYDQISINKRNDAELWLQMGHAALGVASPARADSCARKALAIRMEWEDAIALLGCAQYLNKDYAKAIKTFSRITTSKQQGSLAWLMTGRCYQRLNRVEKAQKAFAKANDLNPESELLALLTK